MKSFYRLKRCIQKKESNLIQVYHMKRIYLNAPEEYYTYSPRRHFRMTEKCNKHTECLFSNYAIVRLAFIYIKKRVEKRMLEENAV